jgi:hypothetical protein
MGITQFKSIARKVWPDPTIDQITPSRPPTPDIGAVNNEMRREEAIRRVSQRCKLAVLEGSNTHFANINKTRRDIWWLNIPLERVKGPRAQNIINLLLYNDLFDEIHHLRVPTSYLRENLWKLKKLREQIDLYLATDNFQDDSECHFQQFVCGCSG